MAKDSTFDFRLARKFALIYVDIDNSLRKIHEEMENAGGPFIEQYDSDCLMIKGLYDDFALIRKNPYKKILAKVLKASLAMEHSVFDEHTGDNMRYYDYKWLEKYFIKYVDGREITDTSIRTYLDNSYLTFYNFKYDYAEKEVDLFFVVTDIPL